MSTTPLHLAFLCLATIAAPAQGDEPAAIHLVSASDYPSLTEGLVLPRAGEYTVKVWASGFSSWKIVVEGRVITLSGKNDQNGSNTDPLWSTIGKITFNPKAPPTFKVVALPVQDDFEPVIKGAKPAPPSPTAVPAWLAFTTDPALNLDPTLHLVRGRLDRIDPVDDARRLASRTRNEGANFVPPTTRQAWLDRAEHVRARLLVSLGLWPMFPKTEMRPELFGKIDRDGYTIEKVVLETLPGHTLSGNLYRPKGKTGRLPLVLCPHGHWADGRVNETPQARCVWWAKKMGCVVFLYDMVGYNDSKPFGHAFLNDRLSRWGLSLATLQTWNSIRALDWAVTLPDVDPARVGCTGESGGGTQTFLLTALDQRIKVSAPVVMVSHKMQGGCLCENCAGLRIGTDNVEIAALTAPRPLKLVGANDWTDETMTVEYPAIRKVYALLGATDRVSADKFEFPHNYNETSRNAVYAFMGRWLVGIEDSGSTKEIPSEVKIEDPETLWTYGKDHPAPSSIKTPDQLETELIGLTGRSIDRLAPTTVAATWEASRALLRTALDVRVGLADPGASELTTREVRRASRDGVSIVHLTVGRTATGDRVPVVRLTPKDPTGRATLVATSRGKAGLVGPDGGPIPLVKALLARGHSVIGYDPLFVGESIDPRRPATSRPTVDHFHTYNPSLAADRAQDLATVLAWARSRPDLREFHLVALGEAGPLALLSRPMLAGLGRTAIDLAGFDFGDGSGPIPPGLDLPGVLGFGGLKAAAALTAPAPLWIGRAPSRFDRAWPTKAYSLADAPGAFRVEEAEADPAALARWIDVGE